MNKKRCNWTIAVAVFTVTLAVFSVSTLSLPFNHKAEAQLGNKLSIKLYIYESGPNHEDMEDVLCT